MSITSRWYPKYRRRALVAPYDARQHKISTEVAAEAQMIVHAVAVMPDHIHLFVGADPTLAAAGIVDRLEGRSSQLMRWEFPALRLRLPTLWSRSYDAGSVGHMIVRVVEAYIAARKGT